MPASVEILERGSGPTVVLLHSSVAGAGQWRRLMDDLAPTYRCRAPNLYGYGGTEAWTTPGAQTLLDQARLLDAVVPDPEERFSLVGHSFGGSVAMKAAELYGARVERLVLIEPNPVFLLVEAGRDKALAEVVALRDGIVTANATGDWSAAAAVFADYWTGAGSWAAMPEARRAKFAAALRPNVHEWDAVLSETTPLATWRETLPARTTLIKSADTVHAIHEVMSLMEMACPNWRVETIPEGGHMAALTRPDLVNPLVKAALS